MRRTTPASCGEEGREECVREGGREGGREGAREGGREGGGEGRGSGLVLGDQGDGEEDNAGQLRRG